MSVPYYDADGITLYLGDCREELAWLKADVLVTDPPYGISHSMWEQNVPAIIGEVRTGRSSTRVLTDEHVKVRNEALVAWKSRPALVFGHWRAPRPAATMMRLVWDRCLTGTGGVGAWAPSDEEIYLLYWPNPKDKGTSKGSILRSPTMRGDSRPDHPTPKPVALMEALIVDCPLGVIADPFAGSGSTLLAARNQGRLAIGVEIEERYCELIALRLAQADLFAAR